MATRNVLLPINTANIEKLAEELRAGVQGCGGATGNVKLTGDHIWTGTFYASLDDSVSSDADAACIAIAQAHNPNTTTTGQQAIANRATELAEVVDAKAQQALDAIATERAAIAAAKTSLANATTLPQVKPIVDGMLDALDKIDQRQAAMIKALRWIALNG